MLPKTEEEKRWHDITLTITIYLSFMILLNTFVGIQTSKGGILERFIHVSQSIIGPWVSFSQLGLPLWFIIGYSVMYYFVWLGYFYLVILKESWV